MERPSFLRRESWRTAPVRPHLFAAKRIVAGRRAPHTRQAVHLPFIIPGKIHHACRAHPYRACRGAGPRPRRHRGAATSATTSIAAAEPSVTTIDAARGNPDRSSCAPAFSIRWRRRSTSRAVGAGQRGARFVLRDRAVQPAPPSGAGAQGARGAAACSSSATCRTTRTTCASGASGSIELGHAIRRCAGPARCSRR